MNGYNFTERVRKILALARDEASRLQSDYVAPEHMLLGLTREGEGVGAAVLLNLGVDFDVLAATTAGLIGPPKRDSTYTGPDLPYTQRGKRALELAMAAARELDHRYVGSEHLLLGLLGDETTIAARALATAGVTRDAARVETLRLLGTPAPNAPPPTGNTGARDPLVTRRAAPLAVDTLDQQNALARLARALEVSERLGAKPTVTLEADGSLTVPLGPDLLITIELPPGLRLRRRDAGASRRDDPGSAQETLGEKPT